MISGVGAGKKTGLDFWQNVCASIQLMRKEVKVCWKDFALIESAPGGGVLTQTAKTPMGSMYRLFLSAQDAVRRPVKSNLRSMESQALE